MQFKLIFLLVSIILIYGLYKLSFKDEKNLRAFAFASIFFYVVYLTWRTFYTMPNENVLAMIFSAILLICEYIAFFQSSMFKIIFASKTKALDNVVLSRNELPTVDVFISTYDESIDVLERTVVGCMNIDYTEHLINIYICDHGKRESVIQLSEKYKINYLTSDDKFDTKAGDINNALTNSSGEFILLLDADMIPKRNIIKKMIGFFNDKTMGFVQSPKVFYNLDTFQYNLNFKDSIPNEQDFFMRSIEAKRAAFNSVLNLGTNSLIRRTAIESIGGIPTGSITEYVALGMLIQSKGYKGVFVNEALALGLAPETFNDLINERDKTCKGNIQVVKKYNPLTTKGLSLMQKLIYIDGFIYWFFGIQKMVYNIIPLLFPLVGISVFKASGFDLLIYFLPVFIANNLYFQTVSNGVRNTVWTHVYETALAPHLLISAISEFFISSKTKRKIIQKNTTTKDEGFSLQLALPYIVLTLLNIISWFVSLDYLNTATNRDDVFIFVNLAWSFYNTFGLFVAMFISNGRKRFRNSERIPVKLFGKLKLNELCCDAIVQDISEKGAKIVIDNTVFENISYKDLTLKLNIAEIGKFDGTIAWSIIKDDKLFIGINFNVIGLKEYSEINELRFDLKNEYIKRSTLTPNTGFLKASYFVFDSMIKSLDESKKTEENTTKPICVSKGSKESLEIINCNL